MWWYCRLRVWGGWLIRVWWCWLWGWVEIVWVVLLKVVIDRYFRVLWGVVFMGFVDFCVILLLVRLWWWVWGKLWRELGVVSCVCCLVSWIGCVWVGCSMWEKVLVRVEWWWRWRWLFFLCCVCCGWWVVVGKFGVVLDKEMWRGWGEGCWG